MNLPYTRDFPAPYLRTAVVFAFAPSFEAFRARWLVRAAMQRGTRPSRSDQCDSALGAQKARQWKSTLKQPKSPPPEGSGIASAPCELRFMRARVRSN